MVTRAWDSNVIEQDNRTEQCEQWTKGLKRSQGTDEGDNGGAPSIAPQVKARARKDTCRNQPGVGVVMVQGGSACAGAGFRRRKTSLRAGRPIRRDGSGDQGLDMLCANRRMDRES